MESSSNKNILSTIRSPSFNFWEIMQEYSRYLFIAGFSGYVATILYIANQNPQAFFSKPFQLSLLVILPFLFAIFMLGQGPPDITVMVIVGILAVFAVFGYLIYTYLTTPPKSTVNQTLSYVTLIVAFAILVVGLSIYYNVFANAIKKQRGWSGFFINFMFYLPCLITDYIKYLFSEYKNTPSVVFILFIFEIILVLLYIYLPSLLHLIYVPKGVSLLDKVAFLSPSNVIATSETWKIDAPLPPDQLENVATIPKVYNSNYALSMWIYINPTILGTAEKEAIIFQYANPKDDYGKPCITYLGNDQWRFMLSNNLNNPDKKDPTLIPLPEYIVKMPSQKWHYIVFNYNLNQVDLFINGDLARTMDLKDNFPKTDESDKIIIGADKPKNVSGAICNIRYFRTPLTSAQIARTYNMLFMSNPPVNNLR
jgi:hypothetical protein